MSSTIGSTGGFSPAMSNGMGHMRRPDPSRMAEDLFSKLDTSGKGYLEKSDLQSAFQKVSSSDSVGVDDVFSSLDGNSDGKVTKEEMTSGFKKLAEALESQFQSMRMSNAMGGGEGMGGPGGANGMPPPPPPGNDAGFTKDELKSQLEEIGSSDSKRSSLISSIVENFDKADTDGDGKVSFKEAMAYDKSMRSASSSAATSDASGSSSASAGNTEAQVMLKILQLMHAYGNFGQDGAAAKISVTA